MKFLSFDCANKSLAYCYMEIQDMRTIYKNLAIQNFEAAKSSIKIIKCGVVDILDGVNIKNTDAVIRARALRIFIEKHINPLELPAETIILIEAQPPHMFGRNSNFTNLLSNAVSTQLCYHFAADYSVEFVSPKLKNKFAFLYPIEFLAGGSSKYANRKKHSKDNGIHFLTIFGQLDSIKAVPKCYYDDVCDAILQTLAFYKYKVLCVKDCKIEKAK